MAQIYKKTTYKHLQNSSSRPVSDTDKNKVTEIINNFVTYFKAKHLG